MKFSNIQLAVLAVALGVTAAPSNNYKGIVARDCEDDVSASASASVSFSEAVKVKAKATSTTTKKSKAKTTAAADSEATAVASGSDDSEAASTTKASKASATADSGSDSGSDATTSASKASATGDSGSDSGDATSAAASSGAATTASPTNGTSSGSSGGSLPASSGTTVLSAAQTIAAGGSFDGGMVMFDRGVSCTGQAEGGDSDAVFNIEEGGSLSNVIIGPNQIEGVHCQGACTITNVWWAAVCEDAFSIKLQDASATTKVIGGGAFGASDKVIQHNGAGTVSISDFTVSDFGKMYRSCGNCKESAERHVIIDGVTATNGDMLVGINENFGDTATITNSKLSGVKEVCTKFTGVSSGSEPTEIGSGADGTTCIFGSDVVVS